METYLKMIAHCSGGMARGLERWPAQGSWVQFQSRTHMGGRFNPGPSWSVCVRQPMNVFLSY